MKLNIERNALIEALTCVKPAVARASALPILSHVAISATKGRVDFTGTDLDITLRTSTAATVEKTGGTTVNCDLLFNVARSFNGNDVEMELVKDFLTVTCGETKFKLQALHIEEFPPEHTFKAKATVKLPQGALRGLLSLTRHAQSTDTSRYMLCGSLVELNGNVTVVACDGRRLATSSAKTEGKLPKHEFVLPSKAVGELLLILRADEEGKSAGDVDIVIGESAARFNADGISLTTKLIEGNYPKWQQVIPDIKKVQPVPVGRVDMLAALRRVALIDETVRLEIENQSLIIRAKGKANNGELSDVLMIPKSKKTSVAFNVHYLIEALDAVDADTVDIYPEELGPAVIKSADQPWLFVVMPMKLSVDSDTTAKTEPAKKPKTFGEQERVTVDGATGTVISSPSKDCYIIKLDSGEIVERMSETIRPLAKIKTEPAKKSSGEKKETVAA